MFDVLLTLTADIAVNSAHLVVRALRHNWLTKSGDLSRLVVSGVPSELTPQVKAVAGQLIAEIEQRERSGIENLDRKRAEEYIVHLAHIVQDIYSGPIDDPQLSQRLLNRLRNSTDDPGASGS